MRQFDVAVIGGGIAGIAIAEIFQRSGRSVILLEQRDKLCAEASASQHGWFHFGSLYSIFPQSHFLRTMIGGVEDLREYYEGFPGMNIKNHFVNGLEFPDSPTSWFRDQPIEYIVAARNDPDFDLFRYADLRSYAKKLFFLFTWETAIKLFISRHRRFSKHNWDSSCSAAKWISSAGLADYSREVISKPKMPDVNLDADHHFRIVGYDRPMRSRRIVIDLVSAFLANGGVAELECDIQEINREGLRRRLVDARGQEFCAQRVILAAGRWAGRFFQRNLNIKVMASPMLVAWPRVSDRHFVRLTPFTHNSINHLHHGDGAEAYSLIGGGHAAPAHDEAACSTVAQQLVTMARHVFPSLHDAELVETYLGYKTEFIAKGAERNYQYTIRELGDEIYEVNPGKFSLCFSLAVDTFRRLTGEGPRSPSNDGADRFDEAEAIVADTRHARIVSRFLAERSCKPDWRAA